MKATSVRLKKQRTGEWRPYWYGQYMEDGKMTEVNLEVPWEGTPPDSGSMRDQGCPVFEASRKAAVKALGKFTDEVRRKGRAEHLTERLIESKTGRSMAYVRIDALCDQWRNLGREKDATEAHLTNCDAHFLRFIEFMKTRKAKAEHLYEVTPDDAAAFVKVMRSTFAPATAQYGVRMLNKAFERFLPVGAANPFSSFIGGRGKKEDGVVHRKPFTPEELQVLLAAARDDAFMYPLIVTAACTGMRRGDVCELKWTDVDLKAGMLTVKTSKTGGNVEIPIFGPLMEVLRGLGKPGKGFVFPEAAAMLKANPNGLTWRFKKIVAKAFDEEAGEEVVPCPPAEILDEGLEAIREHVSDESRRERMLEVLRLYSAGESVRKIEKLVGCARATVSADLHAVQGWLGQSFIAGSSERGGVKAAMARATRVERESGQRAASVRDWHALRATWVTLALSAGVPVELVRRVTGHATVEVVLKHYFRPDREQFRAALVGALPAVLTGKAEKLKPEMLKIAETGGSYGGVKVTGPSEKLEEALEILKGVTGKANQERVARAVELIAGAKGWLDAHVVREGRR